MGSAFLCLLPVFPPSCALPPRREGISGPPDGQRRAAPQRTSMGYQNELLAQTRGPWV